MNSAKPNAKVSTGTRAARAPGAQGRETVAWTPRFTTRPAATWSRLD